MIALSRDGCLCLESPLELVGEAVVEWRKFKISLCPKDPATTFSPPVSDTTRHHPSHTSEMKKPAEEKKSDKGFKSQRHKQPDHKHSELYLRPDSVAISISKQLGVKKRQIVGEKK